MLQLASSIPAVLLAVVLIVSGIAKLRDGASVRESFITLRMPPGLTRSPAPLVLPWAELVLAVALLVFQGLLGILAAVAALGLFLAYLVIIARANGFDEAVECGCLGRLGLGVVGPVTIVRNALLVAIAGWVLVDAFRGESVVTRWADADATAWAWLGVTALALVLAGLMVYAGQDSDETTAAKSQGPVDSMPTDGSTDPIHESADDADYERTPIPHVSLGIPDGGRVHLRQLAASRARLLVFINPGCGACVPALDAVPALRERIGDMIGIHLVFSSTEAVKNPYVTPAALGEEWFVDPEGIFTVTLQLASPGAVLLGADGYLAGGPVSGAQSVVEFFDDVAEALTDSEVEADQTPADVMGGH